MKVTADESSLARSPAFSPRTGLCAFLCTFLYIFVHFCSFLCTFLHEEVDLLRELPVDVLLHEQVEAVIKVAPHVRVEMDSSDALWVRGRVHPVQLGHETAPAIHHHMPEISTVKQKNKTHT